jgi:peroxiredoxin Q/BCP
MNTRRGVVTIISVGVAVLALFSTAANAGVGGLVVGDQAPAFELPGSDGVTHSLVDYRGKQVVVLAWFPKAFTGG